MTAAYYQQLLRADAEFDALCRAEVGGAGAASARLAEACRRFTELYAAEAWRGYLIERHDVVVTSPERDA
jgi:hypothetical protein